MTLATDTRDALLAAIIAEPDDDFPRAVYADWLEENGKPHTAIMIRDELAKPEGQAETWLWWPGLKAPESFTSGYTIRRRGFVETVRCTCAAWLEHGPAFVRQEPVMRVELVDKSPANFGPVDPLNPVPIFERWLYLPSSRARIKGSYLIPDEIYDWLGQPHWLPTCQAAVNALSAACLDYAKGVTP